MTSICIHSPILPILVSSVGSLKKLTCRYLNPAYTLKNNVDEKVYRTYMSDTEAEEYTSKTAAEKQFFEGKDSYKQLPAISQYWATQYLIPRLQEVFNIEDGSEFYLKPIEKRIRAGGAIRILSLGSGAGLLECRLARRLQSLGGDVSIVGVELSPEIVEGANNQARERGVADILSFEPADFNSLKLDREWDFVMANQILHHVTELEGLFTEVSRGLKPYGLLMTRDVIGMNGHQAWPEALSIVNDIWVDMPERYKYHNRLKKPYAAFPNIDFSRKSFEGVRAQDILPLMVSQFFFTNFYAYGGITERFLGRGFGPNFSRDNEDDRSFVTTLQVINDLAIDAGVIKPTQMLAYARNEPSRAKVWRGRTPKFCARAINV